MRSRPFRSRISSRLLKKAHLPRWRAQALVAAYLEYASLGLTLAALHLGLFEQPGHKLKKAHLSASPLVAAYREYASLGTSRSALHLGPF